MKKVFLTFIILFSVIVFLGYLLLQNLTEIFEDDTLDLNDNEMDDWEI